MDYQKFQLADYESGERGDREPWRSLANSWRELTNCAPYRGQLRARPGYAEIGKLWHKYTETFAGTSGLLTYSDNCGGFEVEPGYVTWVAGARSFTEDGAGVILEGATPVGTINYVTGAWTITVGVAFPADLTVRYRAWRPEFGCVGIIECVDLDSSRYLIACSTRRIFKWDATHFVDITGDPAGVDIFTGTQDDLMWFCPFENLLIITNNVDVPKKLTLPTSAIANLATDWDGAAGNDTDKARMILNHKGRLLFINVNEKGSNYSHRVRRTKPNAPEAYYNALDYSDAPTGEPILSAGIIGDTVVCFCAGNRTYAHRYRGDPKFLYDWVQISMEAGSAATHTTIPVEGGLLVLSEQSVRTCDGRTMDKIDRALPRWVRDNLDRSKLDAANGAIYHAYEQAWFSIFKKDEALKSLLVLDMEKGAWAEFDFAFWVYGTCLSDTFSETTWDAMPNLNWDTSPDFDPSWDEYISGAGGSVRTMLAGSTTGVVYVVDHTLLSDDGEKFTVSGKSQLLNPFVEQGMDASLGWIDMQLSRQDGETLTVKLFKDLEETHYAEYTIDLTGERGNTVRRRVPVNCVAQFHAIEFSTMAPAFYCDSLEFYFAPARRMFETPVPA